MDHRAVQLLLQLVHLVLGVLQLQPGDRPLLLAPLGQGVFQVVLGGAVLHLGGGQLFALGLVFGGGDDAQLQQPAGLLRLLLERGEIELGPGQRPAGAHHLGAALPVLQLAQLLQGVDVGGAGVAVLHPGLVDADAEQRLAPRHLLAVAEATLGHVAVQRADHVDHPQRGDEAGELDAGAELARLDGDDGGGEAFHSGSRAGLGRAVTAEAGQLDAAAHPMVAAEARRQQQHEERGEGTHHPLALPRRLQRGVGLLHLQHRLAQLVVVLAQLVGEPPLRLAQPLQFADVAEHRDHPLGRLGLVLEERGAERQGRHRVVRPEEAHHPVVSGVGLVDRVDHRLGEGVVALVEQEQGAEGLAQALLALHPQQRAGRRVEVEHLAVEADGDDPLVDIADDVGVQRRTVAAVFMQGVTLAHGAAPSSNSRSIFQVSRVVPRVWSREVRALR